MGTSGADVPAGWERPAGEVAPEQLAEYHAGFSRITVGRSARRGSLRALVWYPASARETPTIEGVRVLRVARDAVPVAGPFPLVVVSHESGGGPGDHHDTAEHLARRGFVVMAVTHAGDDQDDLSGVLGPVQLLGRARHMSRALDHLLGTEKYARIVDPARIGALGHGVGAYTVSLLAGAVPDFDGFGRHFTLAPEDPVFLPHWEAIVYDLPGEAESSADGRVRGLALLAPALGFLFDPTGLEEVRLPVRVYRAERDTRTPHPYHAQRYAELLPGPVESAVVEGADHQAFIAPCPRAMVEECPDLCVDPPGFDRHAFHARMNRELTKFFGRL